ncbi:hypothetical protein SPBR_08498 [Sporothrix brasiliensis 5110]|uniref:Uncharacterized protein n=1 Tax=Sporothrix brasiliensis 5110 TaxID=1398154 RepID=A0A0C2II04_9PEZI|nr:uncharacterized protein SPBR_08498 [Sporothrix brasiliensis 5110]KIH86595.1 hypothetical protein SPBR_08498 [Sporothrix brasiliensis 5110]
MKTTGAVLAFAGAAAARDISLYKAVLKREVPQEHSHQNILDVVNPILQQNNPLAIQDAVFGLLGNAAAAKGAPNVKDLDCLQQIVADQVFTNAVAAGDVNGQVNAILYRALERNTGSVGLESVLCTQTAVNPEIAAITQHQDPASAAASGNKQIAVNVAKQIAAVGGDPTLANEAGTFAPGKIGDPTAKGNTCDDAADTAGCINSQKLLVADLSAAEIKTAVAGVKVKSRASASVNVQTFTGALGGPPPPVVSSDADPKRPFSVDGSTFVNQGAALQRSCSVQHNACSTAANSGQISGGVAQCETQQSACEAASGAAKRVKKLRRAALDFGSCSNPAIKFAAGLDGRKEESFAPVDSAQFSHGSALNIKVISGFICGQLSSNCKAGADAVSACNSAASAANAASGQAAADAFNSALGVSA